MKKVFVLLFAVFFFASSYAQEHLTFKGVPIDGTLDVCVANLRKAGFLYFTKHNGVAVLYGDFAGFKNCKIGVITPKSIDIVNRITVVFYAENNTWRNIYGTYSALKYMLTNKYGEHIECVEKFEGNSQPRDDNSRMHELRMDRCKYFTIWETNNGIIELELINSDYDEVVRLVYWDKANTAFVQEKAMDDL